MKQFLIFSAAFVLTFPLSAQTRISDYNNIGWFSGTSTLRFSDKWGGHLEYQWRRNDFGRTWQQSLLRTGVNYYINERVKFRLGYSWIETFPYSNYPLNVFGKQFTEHRIYQMGRVAYDEGRVHLLHRYMLEQRWLAKYNNAASTEPDAWAYMNRLRYMFRVQIPIKGKLYASAYDEIFIGFGKNVGQNIFDQNRTGLLLGRKFNNTFRLEGGYFNQTAQLGRQATGKNIFQYNNGFIVNAFWNVDLRN